MVMNARKLPRINDGFSEKHQGHNAYESSKYGGAGSGSKYRGGNQVAYAGPDKRDSPSANSLRSSSPDSRSQSPRYHKSSGSNYYKREREYNAREHRDNREGSRSPKERRRDRHAEHISRNNTMKKDGSSTVRVGDWSEHVSSNGKRYYYNCKSEKSQWEKPQDWLEWEHHHRHSLNKLPHYNNTSKPNYSSSSSSSNLNNNSSSSNSNNNKVSYNNLSHSNLSSSSSSALSSTQLNSKAIATTSSYSSYSKNNTTSSSSNNKSSCYGGTSSALNSLVSNSLSSTNLLHHSNNITNNSKDRTNLLQDKAKLDKHSSIDGRDHHFREDVHFDKRKYASGQDMDISSGGSTPTSESVHNRTLDHSRHKHPSSNSSNNILLSSSRLSSLYSNNNSSNNNSATITTNSSSCDPRHHPSSHHHHNNNNSDGKLSNSHLEPLTVNVNSSSNIQGPPTPTHSESHDGIDIRKGESTRGLTSLSSVSTSTPAPPTVSSLSSLTQQPPQSSQPPWGGHTSSLSSSLSMQRSAQPPPALTPSLAKYFNEALISHVKDWPAENLERQSQRLSEEVHTAGSLIMTKVSADLKMARSLVRLAEIQATLHEQRILFLKAQRRELDELGVRSQNSFMGDPPTSSNS